MYAVIKTGGKQYRVTAGEKIKVEQIAADVGQEIVIDQVLAVGDGADLTVGTPLVFGATVSVTVLAHGKHDKVSIFKMRRRKHYQKRQGHRQLYTELLVSTIATLGALQYTAVASPVETPAALPVETALASPVDTPVALPVETALASPVETPAALPVETAAASPVETPAALPLTDDSAKEENHGA